MCVSVWEKVWEEVVEVVTVNNKKTAPDAAVVREINNKPKYKSGHRKQSQNGR